MVLPLSEGLPVTQSGSTVGRFRPKLLRSEAACALWRRLLAIAGWALPQPSANLNPMPSVARLSRAGAMRPGRPAQLGVMCSPSQRWAAWWLRCCRPHRVGRLFGFTRCALPRRRHLAAPSLTPCTHFGGWRRFPALRAVDHCARLLLCSMWRKRMRKVPSFCCQPLGGSDLGVGLHQVRAVIGSSWFCAACGSRLSGRQLPFPRAVETMSAPSKANVGISRICFWWSWAESNRRPARTHFNLQAAFRLPHDHHTAGRRKPIRVHLPHALAF